MSSINLSDMMSHVSNAQKKKKKTKKTQTSVPSYDCMQTMTIKLCLGLQNGNKTRSSKVILKLMEAAVLIQISI